MAVWLEINGHNTFLSGPVSISDIKHKVLNDFNMCNFYITQNGKLVEDNGVVQGYIRVIPRLLGGKGGFGSMLRAIGAQIEKTTNREACRDLSGRRLRDINEEKRLKNWIAQQAEREHEAAEKRKKKLERLCLEPKHNFSDQSYEKERSELCEKVYDAVEQGFRSASTSSSSKRKTESHNQVPSKKKKTCLWVDDIDENDLSSDNSSDSESEVALQNKVKEQDGTCTGNSDPDSETKECSAAGSVDEMNPDPLPGSFKVGELCSDEDSFHSNIKSLEDKEKHSKKVASTTAC